ncbi:ABC transporter ATP-binding protein, partial [Streptomyces sp. SID7499]|nr:ABC transporter ATP-binding protein [Streptomyces sp. SID7499]
ASLEEAYMRLTQGLVDYRSTEDAKAGLVEPPPQDAYGSIDGYAQPEPVEVPQEGWYAPPAPVPGRSPAPAAVPSPAPAAEPSSAAPAGEQTSKDLR